MHKYLGILSAASCAAALLSVNVLAAPASKTPAKAPAKSTAAKPVKPAAKATPKPAPKPAAPGAPADGREMTREEIEQMMGGMGGPGGQPAAPAGPVDRLFGRNSSEEEFKKDLLAAREAKAPEQILLEARLLRHLRNDEIDAAADMIPEVEKATTGFTPENSKLFNSPQAFQGFLTGLRALDARRKDDAAGFEKLIKDAFWQSPELAPLYSQWATEFQEEQATAQLTLPLDIPIASADGGTQTLKQLIGTNKAALIDVWASWCQFCMIAMPELPGKAKKLAPQGVVLAGMNVGDGVEIAANVKQTRGLSLPWLVEPDTLPYTKLLKINTLPRMILVTPDGKVLFNGHPNSPKLKRALQKIGAEL